MMSMAGASGLRPGTAASPVLSLRRLTGDAVIAPRISRLLPMRGYRAKLHPANRRAKMSPECGVIGIARGVLGF